MKDVKRIAGQVNKIWWHSAGKHASYLRNTHEVALTSPYAGEGYLALARSGHFSYLTQTIGEGEVIRPQPLLNEKSLGKKAASSPRELAI